MGIFTNIVLLGSSRNLAWFESLLDVPLGTSKEVLHCHVLNPVIMSHHYVGHDLGLVV